MRLAYFPNQTALQSESVWRSFLDGWCSHGLNIEENSMTADAALIWSVLWQGRMHSNKQVFEHYRKQGKPVFIIEVGALMRGHTWKVSVNNITAQGSYANQENFIFGRAEKLGIALEPEKNSRKSEILITLQHDRSLQWQGMPSTAAWLDQTIKEIKKYSSKSIVIRPHPRGSLRNPVIPGVRVEYPRKLVNTYDKFDINFNYHCVINWNSGVAVQAAISGTPVITGPTSLASEISGNFANIDNILLPDRQHWFEKILHTEWTVEELQQGIPQKRLLDNIKI